MCVPRTVGVTELSEVDGFVAGVPEPELPVVEVVPETLGVGANIVACSGSEVSVHCKEHWQVNRRRDVAEISR